jgi:hypothetical protein
MNKTNLAKEVVVMCEKLKNLKGFRQNYSIINVLSDNFDSNEYSFLPCEVYKERLFELIFILNSLNEDHVDTDFRDEVVKSCQRMTRLFDVKNLNEPFSSTYSSHIQSIDISNIKGMSTELNRVDPIMKLDFEEVDEIIKKYDVVYDALMNKSNLNDFSVYSISHGLNRLDFSLKYYEIFGSFSVLDSIYILFKDIEFIERKKDKFPELSDLKEAISKIIRSIVVVDSSADRAISVYGKASIAYEISKAGIKLLSGPS